MTAKLLNKATALAEYLNVDIDRVKQDINGNVVFVEVFEYGRTQQAEYLVINNRQADRMCAEEIENLLWAFNAEFIAKHTKNGLSTKAIDSLKKMQSELCEDANDIMQALIVNISVFIQDAIDADGRGHFLSGYDGEELGLKGGLFAYRVN